MEQVTILSLFAGRVYCFWSYFNTLKLLNYPKGKIDLIWITNSTDQEFINALLAKKEELQGYNSIRIEVVKDKPPDNYAFKEDYELKDVKGGSNHAQIIADLYNLGFQYNQNEFIFLLEDDAICHPDTVKRLLQLIKGDKVGYATTSYKCRHTAKVSPSFAQHIIFNDQTIWAQFENTKEYNDVQEIDYSGWVAAMTRKSVIEELPKPVCKTRGVIPGTHLLLGPDVIFCGELRGLGYKCLCDFSFKTGHLDTKGYIH
jgi:hypothetical protein